LGVLAKPPKRVILIGDPRHYRIEDAYNSFMIEGRYAYARDPEEFQRVAAQQCRNLDLCLQTLGAATLPVIPNPKHADGLYMRDQGLNFLPVDKFIPARFAPLPRLDEEKTVMALLKPEHLYALPCSAQNPYTLEGGDHIPTPYTRDGRAVSFIGYGPRTSQGAIWHLQQNVPDMELIPVQLTAQHFHGLQSNLHLADFYHGDTAMNVLPQGEIVTYLPAITPEGFKAISDFAVAFGKRIYPLRKEQAVRGFANNILAVGDSDLVVPEIDDDLNSWLKSCGYRVHQVPMSHFMYSGGGPRCLTLEISFDWLNDKGRALFFRHNPRFAGDVAARHRAALG
jgi:N-dimethylarginine dimethylaminohydrolase